MLVCKEDVDFDGQCASGMIKIVNVPRGLCPEIADRCLGLPEYQFQLYTLKSVPLRKCNKDEKAFNFYLFEEKDNWVLDRELF